MSKINYNPTRGMRDFLPQEMLQRKRVLQTIESFYTNNGFLPIATPIVESKEFLSKGNEESENAKLGYDVTASRSSSDDAKFGLRYDLTVPLSRFYANNKMVLPLPFRASQIGEVFRAERPQRGRYRQFTQCDIDVMGDTTVMAEADVLSTVLDLLEELKVEDVSLNVNDKSFLVKLLYSYGFVEDNIAELIRLIDKLDKVPSEKILTVVKDRFALEPVTKLFEDFEKVNAMSTVDRLGYFEFLLEDSFLPELVSVLGNTKIVFNPFLARGMDYYTGIIFEIKAGRDNLSLAAGGRYDNFKSATSAVGLSLGFERLMDLIPAYNVKGNKCVLVYDKGMSAGTVMDAKKGLIGQGYEVTLQPRPKNLNALLSKIGDLYGNFASVRADYDGVSPVEVKEIEG